MLGGIFVLQTSGTVATPKEKKTNNNNNKNYYYFPRFTPLACKEGWERQKRAVIEAISTLENLQWAAVIGDDVELESVLMIVHSSHGTSF